MDSFLIFVCLRWCYVVLNICQDFNLFQGNDPASAIVPDTWLASFAGEADIAICEAGSDVVMYLDRRGWPMLTGGQQTYGGGSGGKLILCEHSNSNTDAFIVIITFLLIDQNVYYYLIPLVNIEA